MADHNCEPTSPKARKEHCCIWCGGPILAGEYYKQQTGFYDGAPYRNRYHAECWDDAAACDWDDGEFMPYCADYPERVAAIVEARRLQATTTEAPQ
jgi:hypothetical protein